MVLAAGMLLMGCAGPQKGAEERETAPVADTETVDFSVCDGTPARDLGLCQSVAAMPGYTVKLDGGAKSEVPDGETIIRGELLPQHLDQDPAAWRDALQSVSQDFFDATQK